MGVMLGGLLVLGLIVAGWILYYSFETQRDLALQETARRLGMNFRFGLPQELKDVLPRFRAIEKAIEAGGEFQAGLNSITGTRRGRKVAYFEFQWVTVTYSSRNRGFPWAEERAYRHTHTRSAIAAEMGVAVQPVLIRPERWVDKAAALVGYDDIDFSGLPEFSHRFYVNSPDREFARRLVTRRLSRFFLERVRCSVDFVGPWLLVYNNSIHRASHVPKLIEFASELADLVTLEQSGLG